MRKFIFGLAAFICVCQVSAAQAIVSLKGFRPNVKVELKRCVVSGSAGFIDLMITNYSGENFEPRAYSGMHDNSSISTLLYDDEGNVYKWYDGSLRVTFGGKTGIACEYTEIVAMLPNEVPVKLRIDIDNVSEYATEFLLLQIPFRNARTWGELGIVEIKHIPITRKD